MVFNYEGEIKRSGELSFLGVFGSIAKFFKRGSSAIKRTLENVIVEIESSLMSIDEVMSKLKKRYDDLYTLALKAVAEKNIARATIYVNELIEIRSIYKRLTISYNFLEQLKIRLQTLNELDKLMPTLLSAKNSIEYLKPQIAPIVPGVALSLDRISSEINYILTSSSIPAPIEGADQFRPVNKEAEELMKKIVAEAERMVESKLPKLIPELSKLVNKPLIEQEVSLPSDTFAVAVQKPQAAPIQAGGQPINTTNTVANRNDVQQYRRSSKIEEVEDRLIDYIVSRGGFLDINDFCRIYGYSRDEVKVALDNLVAKGKINIVNKSREV